jgi:hypothetical protein
MAIDCFPQTVDHASEKGITGGDPIVVAAHADLAPGMNSVHLAERHEEHAVLAESNYFTEHAHFVSRGTNFTQITKAHMRTVGLDEQTGHLGDTTDALKRWRVLKTAAEILNPICGFSDHGSSPREAAIFPSLFSMRASTLPKRVTA